MRFMMLVKASEVLPDMRTYNEQLAKAGVLLDLSGLQPNGARVKFSGGKSLVIDDQGSIAGYWLIQARSKEEAIEWAKRVPFQDGEIEIRRLLELSNDAV
ncbi:MAG: YciI family protein [Acidobacteriota bacterium]|nr:YciI family protein [Acidobacteriota bacterium]